MKLKTLKDLKGVGIDILEGFDSIEWVEKKELKQEAIKWVIEDFKWIGSTGAEKALVMRWMERLNITEKDLK